MNETITTLENSLQNYWDKFVSQTPKIILALIIIILGFLISKFISNLFRRTIAKRSQDILMTNFLTKTLRFALILMAIMLALKIAGLDGIATGLITAAGASAVIIGFAFRDIGENFISGVILSFSRPFDVDDTVMVGDIFGKVKALEFRYTKMKTFDGRDVYIPNSDIIKKAVFNYTEDGYFRLDFTVGIDYDDSIDLAKEVILNAVIGTEGVIHTEDHKCFVTVDSLGTSTVNMKVLFWTKTMDYKIAAHEIKSDIVKHVKNTIIENGLNMPADITEIKLYGSQTSIPVTVKQEKADD